jgi:hypothetical protein
VAPAQVPAASSPRSLAHSREEEGSGLARVPSGLVYEVVPEYSRAAWCQNWRLEEREPLVGFLHVEGGQECGTPASSWGTQAFRASRRLTTCVFWFLLVNHRCPAISRARQSHRLAPSPATALSREYSRGSSGLEEEEEGRGRSQTRTGLGFPLWHRGGSCEDLHPAPSGAVSPTVLSGYVAASLTGGNVQTSQAPG